MQPGVADLQPRDLARREEARRLAEHGQRPRRDGLALLLVRHELAEGRVRVLVGGDDRAGGALAVDETYVLAPLQLAPLVGVDLKTQPCENASSARTVVQAVVLTVYSSLTPSSRMSRTIGRPGTSV